MSFVLIAWRRQTRNERLDIGHWRFRGHVVLVKRGGAVLLTRPNQDEEGVHAVDRGSES